MTKEKKFIYKARFGFKRRRTDCALKQAEALNRDRGAFSTVF